MNAKSNVPSAGRTYFVAIAWMWPFTSRTKARSWSTRSASSSLSTSRSKLSSGNLESIGSSLLRAGPDHRIDPVAGAERELELVCVRGQGVREELAEQDLAEAASSLRRAKRLLEPGEVGRLLEHLRGGAVELPESLDDLGRGLPRRALALEQAPVDAFQPPVDLFLQAGQPLRELPLDSAQSLLQQPVVGGLSGGKRPPRRNRSGGEKEDDNDDESDQHRAAERSAGSDGAARRSQKPQKTPDPASPRAYRI